MSPIPLSVLGGVFVVWLLGTLLVLWVLTSEGARAEPGEEPDRRRGHSSR